MTSRNSTAGRDRTVNNIDLQEVQFSDRQILQQPSEPHIQANIDQDHFRVLTPESNVVKDESQVARATYMCSTTALDHMPISINSAQLKFHQPAMGLSRTAGNQKDPMQKYQPIVKNLRDMALRNRNFLQADKVKMPLLNAQKLSQRNPGATSEPSSPVSLKQNPMRQQFYQKYIEEEDQGCGRIVRNMVYANKEEREQEKSVCAYIVQKVLNQGNLTKITGITTKEELDKQANAKRQQRQKEARIEAERIEAEMKASEVFSFKSIDADNEQSVERSEFKPEDDAGKSQRKSTHKRVKTAKVRLNQNKLMLENDNIAPEVKEKLAESMKEQEMQLKPRVSPKRRHQRILSSRVSPNTMIASLANPMSKQSNYNQLSATTTLEIVDYREPLNSSRPLSSIPNYRPRRLRNNYSQARTYQTSKSLNHAKTKAQLMKSLEDFQAMRSQASKLMLSQRDQESKTGQAMAVSLKLKHQAEAPLVSKRVNYNTLLLKTYDQFTLKNERRQLQAMQRQSNQSQKRVSLETRDHADQPDQTRVLLIQKLTDYEAKNRSRLVLKRQQLEKMQDQAGVVSQSFRVH